MIYPAKLHFIPPFYPPNTNLSRQKLAGLGEKCWNLQNYLDKSVVEIQKYLDKSVVEIQKYLDKSVVEIQKYLDKSVVGIHFYQDKSVKSAFFANFTKKHRQR